MAAAYWNFYEVNNRYDDFLKASKIINVSHMDDIKWLLENDFVDLNIDDNAGTLVASGLFKIEQISLSLKLAQEDTWNNSAGEHKIEGGKLKTRISYIAKRIRKILNIIN